MFVNSSSDPGDPGQVVARVLRPPVWHNRLPWFTYTDPVSGNVTFNGAAPDVMDAEIEMAVAAGIDHWAFDVYPDDTDLAAALHAYLNSTSPARAELFFCLLLQASWMANGGLSGWPAKVAVYAAHFARPSYRVVLGNRPLVYLFGAGERDWNSSAVSGWADWAAALGVLSNASLAAGRGLPYVVLQVWDASQGAAFVAGVNGAAKSEAIAALSSYALASLRQQCRYWPGWPCISSRYWPGWPCTKGRYWPGWPCPSSHSRVEMGNRKGKLL
jgi:hypothetical protein